MGGGSTRLRADTCRVGHISSTGASRDSEPSAGRRPASTQHNNLETESSKDLNSSFIVPKGKSARQLRYLLYLPAVASVKVQTTELHYIQLEGKGFSQVSLVILPVISHVGQRGWGKSAQYQRL